jgi:hypothetical protein
MSDRTLTNYDRRELSVMRGALREAIKNLEWMEEDKRSPSDRELRAMRVAGMTAHVSQRAKNFERRWRK